MESKTIRLRLPKRPERVRITLPKPERFRMKLKAVRLQKKVKELEEELHILRSDIANKVCAKQKRVYDETKHKMWHCTHCDRDIKSKSRYGHVKSKKHRIAAGEIEDDSLPREKWRCEICDKEISLQGKKFHLSSATHCKNAIQQRTISPSVSQT